MDVTGDGALPRRPPPAGKKTQEPPNGQHTTVRFDEFWAAIPEEYRDGEEDSRVMWKKLGLDPLADLIIDDVKRRAAEDYRWRGDGPGEIKWFLFGKGWQNRIVNNPPSGGRHGRFRLNGADIPFD